jgi:sulfonate transport system permease protein
VSETLSIETVKAKPPKPSFWARVARFNWTGTATLVVLLLLWELADRLGWVDFDFIPAPSEMIGGAIELLSDGELQTAIGHTTSVALLGWVIAVAIGLAIGTIMGLSPVVWRWTAASVEVLRSFPSITFVSLAVLLFGFSVAMELVVVIYAATWPVLVNTLEGVRTVNPKLTDVARTFQLGPVRRITAIVLPAAASKIFVGLRLGLNLALILAVAAEVVGNPAGLGYGLVVEQQALRPDRMFVYFISVGLLGIVLNAVLQLLISVAFRGITAATERGRRS